MCLALAVPVAETPAATVTPGITLSASCGSVGSTVQVNGSGWIPRFSVTIQFDPQGTPAYSVQATPDGNGSFTTAMIVPSRPFRGAPYQVVATENTPTPSPTPTPVIGQVVGPSPVALLAARLATVTAPGVPFYIPCPSLALNPACGSTPEPFQVHGQGFRPDVIVQISFTPPAGAAPLATAVPGGDSTFNVNVNVPTDPPGTYVVTAIQLRTQVTARATFQIPCVKAAITLVPKVGPPGTVVTVTGTGFLVGAAVRLSWSQGIPLKMQSITIGSSQGFKVTVLIFWHDQLGLRHMDAGPDLTVTTAPLFNIATADFLVVPGSEQPRDFSWRR